MQGKIENCNWEKRKSREGNNRVKNVINSPIQCELCAPASSLNVLNSAIQYSASFRPLLWSPQSHSHAI